MHTQLPASPDTVKSMFAPFTAHDTYRSQSTCSGVKCQHTARTRRGHRDRRKQIRITTMTLTSGVHPIGELKVPAALAAAARHASTRRSMWKEGRVEVSPLLLNHRCESAVEQTWLIHYHRRHRQCSLTRTLRMCLRVFFDSCSSSISSLAA